MLFHFKVTLLILYRSAVYVDHVKELAIGRDSRLSDDPISNFGIGNSGVEGKQSFEPTHPFLDFDRCDLLGIEVHYSQLICISMNHVKNIPVGSKSQARADVESL